MKVAVFKVVSNGIDGMDKEQIVYSSINEEERDQFFETLKNKNYYRKKETVEDLKMLARNLLNRLNGNDKMILRECLLFDEKENGLSFTYYDQTFDLLSKK